MEYFPSTNQQEVIFKDLKITCSEARVSNNVDSIEIVTKNVVCLLTTAKPSNIPSATKPNKPNSVTPPPVPQGKCPAQRYRSNCIHQYERKVYFIIYGF